MIKNLTAVEFVEKYIEMIVLCDEAMKTNNYRLNNKYVDKFIKTYDVYLDEHTTIVEEIVNLFFLHKSVKIKCCAALYALSYGVMITEAIDHIRYVLDNYRESKDKDECKAYMCASGIKADIDRKGYKKLFPQQKNYATYNKDWFPYKCKTVFD